MPVHMRSFVQARHKLICVAGLAGQIASGVKQLHGVALHCIGSAFKGIADPSIVPIAYIIHI